MRLDKTKLVMYLSNKSQFKKVYIDGIREDNVYMYQGRLKHKIIENVFQEYTRFNGSSDSFMEYLKNQYNTSEKQKITYEFCYGLLKRFEGMRVIGLEKFLTINFIDGINLVGFTDMIFCYHNKNYLIDFKSSLKNHKEINGVNIDDFEINYYAFLAEKHLGIKIYGGFLGDINHNKILHIDIDNNFQEKLSKLVIEVKKWVENNGGFVVKSLTENIVN